jgi:hypothetical protein
MVGTTETARIVGTDMASLPSLSAAFGIAGTIFMLVVRMPTICVIAITSFTGGSASSQMMGRGIGIGSRMTEVRAKRSGTASVRERTGSTDTILPQIRDHPACLRKTEP